VKLNDFLATVLQDINDGLRQAGANTDRKYSIGTTDNQGVSFDIAVTTVNTSGTQAEGQAKAGFIEVLGANVGAKVEDKKENSQVSRIRFTVHVPYQTTQEAEEGRRELVAKQRAVADWFDPYPRSL
jgi:hypothetical protein